MSKGNLVLGRTEDGGILSLDLGKLIQTRLLIQASSGNGKSMTLRRILEITHGKIPQIVFDHEGEFSTLREKFDYVLAGKDGDIPAIPAHAGILARRMLELNTSIIIDLFELQPLERHRFVRLFIEGLMNAPKELWGMRLVVLDEAHIYCPEKGEGSSEAKEAVADLLSRGRKRGLGSILATQRLAKLSKDAAAECGNKLIGGTNYADDRERAAKELGMSRKDGDVLLSLEPGHFMAIGRALSKSVVRAEIVKATTTHPEIGKNQKRHVPAPTAQVKAVLAKLGDLPKEAAIEVKDLSEAKAALHIQNREVVRLKSVVEDLNRQVQRQIAHSETLSKREPTKITTIKVPAIGARTIKKVEKGIKLVAKQLKKFEGAQRELEITSADLGSSMEELAEKIKTATEKPEISKWEIPDQKKLKSSKNPIPGFETGKFGVFRSVEMYPDIAASQLKKEVAATVALAQPEESNGMGGEKKVLQALVAYASSKQGFTDPPTKEDSSIPREDLGVISLQSHSSGTFSTYLSRLKGKGFITAERGFVVLMAKGYFEVSREALTDLSPSLLRGQWYSRLGGERNLLKILIERRSATRLELGGLAGMSSTSGTFSTYLSRLNGKGLIRLDTVSKCLIPNPLLVD